MKRCPKCEIIKPLTDFGSHARNWNGLQTRCRPCIREDSRARKGFGRVLSNRMWREANPGMSKCSKCGESKKFADFKKGHRGQVVASWCRMCHSKARVAAYHARPEKERAAGKRWQRANRDKKAADLAAYRTRKMEAMPKWANPSAIAELYQISDAISAFTGVRYHVDHVIPLRGRTVCGLHCEANLQVIPARLNQSKGNRLIDGAPNG